VQVEVELDVDGHTLNLFALAVPLDPDVVPPSPPDEQASTKTEARIEEESAREAKWRSVFTSISATTNGAPASRRPSSLGRPL